MTTVLIIYLLAMLALGKFVAFGNPSTEHPLMRRTQHIQHRQRRHWLGALLFVLLLNAAYYTATACEGNYQPYTPHPVPELVCARC